MRPHPPLLLIAAAAVLVATAMAGCSKPAGMSVASPAASSPAANVSDIDVTEHVKTALHQTASLKGIDITVVTLKGDVRLIGVLDSQAQIDDAIRIARAADGAHAIHDELTIRP
jgi:osmotically-inducible protein OsmY